MSLSSPYRSLSDYLLSNELDLDGALDSGWGFQFPAKGREINAAVLFADISSFSSRTADMSPAETLVFVQNFFAWVTAEALDGRPGVIDKYIGDEVMVIFSKEFGSADPFADAVKAAAAMSRNDVHAYQPHIGIAYGKVIVGTVGTAFKYDVSVFGAPVALAARCAGVKLEPSESYYSSNITFPANAWAGRELNTVISDNVTTTGVGEGSTSYASFELLNPRTVPMKGLGDIEVREIVNVGMWAPMENASSRASNSIRSLQESGKYRPRGEL